MFRMVSLSIIRSLRLYKQHQVSVVQVLWLLASKLPQNLYDISCIIKCLIINDAQCKHEDY